MKEGFIVLTDTLCQGLQSWFNDEKGAPVVYDTEREAQLDLVEEIEDRIANFRDGQREFNDIVPDAEIVSCTVYEDGAICSHDDTFEWRPGNEA